GGPATASQRQLHVATRAAIGREAQDYRRASRPDGSAHRTGGRPGHAGATWSPSTKGTTGLMHSAYADCTPGGLDVPVRPKKHSRKNADRPAFDTNKGKSECGAGQSPSGIGHMGNRALNNVLKHVRKLGVVHGPANLSDRELLERFVH